VYEGPIFNNLPPLSRKREWFKQLHLRKDCFFPSAREKKRGGVQRGRELQGVKLSWWGGEKEVSYGNE
jgi:hypothetical protein